MASPKCFDFCRSLATVTGTGNVTIGTTPILAPQTLAGHPQLVNGDKIYYAIFEVDAGLNPVAFGQYEVGIGTYISASFQLSRDVVIYGSNGTSLVNFSAFVTKHITCTIPSVVVNERTVPTATVIESAALTAPTGYLSADGTAVNRVTYADLFAALSKSGTVTITNASPAVVTWNAHGMGDGAPVYFTTTGGLPTGLTASTVYYVKNSTTNTFQLSATVGGAAINTSSAGSGTHTAWYLPFGPGNFSTTFNVPNRPRRVGVGAGGTATTTLGNTLGATGGEEAHANTSAENGPHTHNADRGSNAGLTATVSGGGAGYFYVNTATATTSSGNGDPHNNMQPSIVMNYYIKY